MFCGFFPHPRGVVQLFNAVRTHQKNVDEKVKKGGSSDRQRAKLLSSVSKKDFINVLRNMEGAKGSKNSAGKATKSKQVSFVWEKKHIHDTFLVSVQHCPLMSLLFRTAVIQVPGGFLRLLRNGASSS